jgi:ABC-type transport system involved in multi-copper enzyme maturation permease subunit
MKPYFAILIDSFWEAVGNRVLWVLLIGWALVLAGLAPFGYVTERSFKLSSNDIDDFNKIKARLLDGAKGRDNESVQAVAARLSPDFVEKLKPVPESGGDNRGRSVRASDMANELNAVIDAKDLYTAEAFPSAAKRPRLKPLIEPGVNKLSEFEREELNRELLQLAFPLELARPRSEQLWIGYAGFKLGEPINISRKQIKQFVEPLLLGFLIKLGLGVVAVFVALIVTSPIVPETFRSGSLHLLLSKPISRIWLYLFKLFGGCIFVLFNITFVLIGLYLIAGIRFDIWNEGLLYCIPLLLFVFIIFYSVSSLVGLLWGNAIVCVVSCIIFWLFCFAIGAIHDGMQQHVELLPQITRVDKIAGKLMAVNQRGDFSLWNEKFSLWQPAIDTEFGGQARTFGPLYDAKRNQIVVKTFFRSPPFAGLAAPSRKISFIRLGEEVDKNLKGDEKLDQAETPSAAAPKQQPTESAAEIEKGVTRDPISFSEARSTSYWMSETGPEIPQQLIEMTQVGGELITVCRGGIFRLNWDKVVSASANSPMLGMLRKLIPGSQEFENIGPKDFVMSDNSSAAATANGNGLIIYSSGNVDVLKYEKSRFEVVSTTKIAGEGTEPALVIANDKYCVVARDSLPLIVFDAELKSVHSDIPLPNKNNVRQLVWIPGSNQAAIITHTGNWFKLDCESGKVSTIPSPFGGKLTTMTWESPNKVLLGVKPNRVVEFDPADNKVSHSYTPTMSTLELVYNLGVNPLYQLNPKPSALDNAMGYLLSGNETLSLNIVTNDMKQAQVEIDVWRPIFSNLAFVGVMLVIGCVYVARKEF